MAVRRVAEEVGRTRVVVSGVVARRWGMSLRPMLPEAEVRRMDLGGIFWGGFYFGGLWLLGFLLLRRVFFCGGFLGLGGGFVCWVEGVVWEMVVLGLDSLVVLDMLVASMFSSSEID